MLRLDLRYALPESGPLPSADGFAERRTRIEKHSTKTALPSGKHSAKMALAKEPLVAVYRWRPSAFAEGRKSALGKADYLPSVKYLALGKEGLYRVSSMDTRQSIFYFGHQTFCGMFLHYIDLHVPFWDNYNSVFNR
jgi:hypothetical protein